MNSLLQWALFLVVSPAIADYQAGLDAYQAGDFTTAMTEWKEVAGQQPERKDLALYRESLYAIGMLYWQGEGVEQDYGVSAVWLKQAADINHPGAQAKLGYLYSTGLGVPRNTGEARKWFEMAAAQGDPDAKYNLDVLDREIPGVTTEQTETPPEVVAAPEAASAGHVEDEAWILEQNPESYTIQVIALRAPENLHAFATENPDWAPFAVYRQTGYTGALWVMVQGVYADVDAARAARAEFPSGFQKKDDLWIRRFGMVQRLIE